MERAAAVILTSLILGGPAADVSAIEIQPSSEDVRRAIDRGVEAAKSHSPPDSFYVRFGASDDIHAGGFLVTKLGSLSVMATHMALRGLEPSGADVAQVLEGKTMLVSATIFGNVGNFAVDSYMVLDQQGKTIKPVNVRFDAVAGRSAAYPDQPKFKAKVVASFDYRDFDPRAATTITVFPANGGEVSFPVEFSEIK